MTDNKGVVFLKQRRLMGQIVFEGGLKAIIANVVRYQAQARKQPPRVRVNHKYGLVRCIQDDGIRCLWANAVNGKQFVAQGLDCLGG